MGKKRKRSGGECVSCPPTKHQKLEKGFMSNRLLLSLYYTEVSTLRDYILSCFPKSSKSRKQRIKSIPRWDGDATVIDRSSNANDPGLSSVPSLGMSTNVSRLLDTTVVGHGLESRSPQTLPQKQDLKYLSQKLVSSLRSSGSNGYVTQHEVYFPFPIITACDIKSS